MTVPIAITAVVGDQGLPAVLENPHLWMIGTGLGVLTALIVTLHSYRQIRRLTQQLQRERYLSQDLRKKMRMALQTLSKMERNPDLIHSREFNLDYLRLRMEEEFFHAVIVNQLKAKVKQKITTALRPSPSPMGLGGRARIVDEIFDVEYKLDDTSTANQRVLFRSQIKLAKLPTQTTSATIKELISCIENFMDSSLQDSHWQPTIQGRIAHIHWDQKAKPTPLLVVEQSNDGATITFRSKNISPLNPTPSAG
jgi:hypothetical protein